MSNYLFAPSPIRGAFLLTAIAVSAVLSACSPAETDQGSGPNAQTVWTLISYNQRQATLVQVKTIKPAADHLFAADTMVVRTPGTGFKPGEIYVNSHSLIDCSKKQTALLYAGTYDQSGSLRRTLSSPRLDWQATDPQSQGGDLVQYVCASDELRTKLGYTFQPLADHELAMTIVHKNQEDRPSSGVTNQGAKVSR
jgi:hypothetical protein